MSFKFLNLNTKKQCFIHKVHGMARPYPDLHIVPPFSSCFYFSGSLQPTSISGANKGPLLGPLYILDCRSSQRILHQGEKWRRRVAECQKDLQDHLFLFRTCIQLSLVLKFLACKIALMLMAFSVRACFDASIRL